MSRPPSSSPGPLSDLKVLDLSRILAGPYCTQLFADLGATVVKVESPGGDDTRRWGPPFYDGVATYYLSVNRGKRSVVVDLKRPGGRRIVHELAAWADVAVDNFRPGGAVRLGADPDTLAALNPRLIHASISGYGQAGDPSSTRLPGYDLILQGVCGVAALTGQSEGPPHKAGVPIADLVAGQNAFAGIMTALYARERTGCGQHLDVSLFDGQLSLLVNHASGWLCAHVAPGRSGNAHPSICPYETFEAADGFFNIACGNDVQFRALCHVLNADGVADDPRFAHNPERVRNREALLALMAPVFAQHSRHHWLKRLSEVNVPAGPINTVPEALAHPQTVARQRVVRCGGGDRAPVSTIAAPLGFSEPTYTDLPPPRLGEHTAWVLKDVLGYGDAELGAALAVGDAVAGE